MRHDTGDWFKTVPPAVMYAAYDMAVDLVDPDPAARFEQAGQHSSFMHTMRVGASLIHFAQHHDLSEKTQHRLGLKGILHDWAKPEVPGISDKGEWTQRRRLWVRKQHTRLGGLFVARHMGHVEDAAGLRFAVEEHHTDIPADYMYRPPQEAQWWGDVHALQIFDRMDAVSTRPYVAERHGAVTAGNIVELALSADHRAGTQALSHQVYIDGRVIDVLPNLNAIARAVVPA